MKIYIVLYQQKHRHSDPSYFHDVDSVWTSKKKSNEYAELMNDLTDDYFSVVTMETNNKSMFLPELRRALKSQITN